MPDLEKRTTITTRTTVTLSEPELQHLVESEFRRQGLIPKDAKVDVEISVHSQGFCQGAMVEWVMTEQADG